MALHGVDDATGFVCQKRSMTFALSVPVGSCQLQRTLDPTGAALEVRHSQLTTWAWFV